MREWTFTAWRPDGNAVRSRRKALCLTQRKLAELAHVERKAIIGMEQGQTVPRLDTAIQVCYALGLGVDELFQIPASEPTYTEVST